MLPSHYFRARARNRLVLVKFSPITPPVPRFFWSLLSLRPFSHRRPLSGCRNDQPASNRVAPSPTAQPVPAPKDAPPSTTRRPLADVPARALRSTASPTWRFRTRSPKRRNSTRARRLRTLPSLAAIRVYRRTAGRDFQRSNLNRKESLSKTFYRTMRGGKPTAHDGLRRAACFNRSTLIAGSAPTARSTRAGRVATGDVRWRRHQAARSLARQIADVYGRWRSATPRLRDRRRRRRALQCIDFFTGKLVGQARRFRASMALARGKWVRRRLQEAAPPRSSYSPPLTALLRETPLDDDSQVAGSSAVCFSAIRSIPAAEGMFVHANRTAATEWTNK